MASKTRWTRSGLMYSTSNRSLEYSCYVNVVGSKKRWLCLIHVYNIRTEEAIYTHFYKTSAKKGKAAVDKFLAETLNCEVKDIVIESNCQVKDIVIENNWENRTDYTY